MRVDLYARVSTEDQDVNQQIIHLRKWAVDKGYRIASETFDTQSGKIELEQREQFMNLLKNPKGEALVVFNLDRLTRNWDSVVYLERHFRESWNKYKLISTKDEINLETASGRLMFRIKLAINCHMPEDMLEKQRIGIERAKAQGKYKGRLKGAKSKPKESIY
jgi:DNA invertase Pin-like site-specific DNA recombinase